MGNIIQELSAFLTPLPCFANESSRRAVLINAGLSDLLPSVNLNGSAYDCVASILNDFEQYGRTDALAALLQEIRQMVGGDKQREIDRLTTLVNMPRPKPAQPRVMPHSTTPTYQTTVYAEKVTFQQGDNMATENINVGRDYIRNSQQFTTGASIHGDHAQQLANMLTPQSTPQDLAAFLAKLREMVTQSGMEDGEKEEIENDLKTAEIQAKKEKPDKKKTVDALDNAKSILTKIGETVPQAVAIGQLLGKAIDFVSTLM